MASQNGFEDLLGSRSPSSSPVATKSAFFSEELSNPFADLPASASRFIPPSPSALPAVSPSPSARTAPLDSPRSPVHSEPPASPTAVLKSPLLPPPALPTPLKEEPEPNGVDEDHLRAVSSPPTSAPLETPNDRVLVSPFEAPPNMGLPSPALVQNGSALIEPPPALPVVEEKPAVEDALDRLSLRSAQPVADDAESIRTVGLESDRASVRSAATTPVPLFDNTAKQGIVVSVGDPQKMGSELIASAHTVYTVRTKVLSEGRASFRKSDFSVLRRFSHFLWLFEQLSSNNPGVIVPAPPEKVVLGRFSSEFVEQRRRALQSCLQRIVNHPMLVSDPDLRLFLESDTFSVDIKHRKADSNSGGLFASLSSAVVSPRYTETDEYFIARKQFLDSLEPQLKSLNGVLAAAAKARAALAASTGELTAAIANIATLTGSLPKPNRDALVALGALKKRARELDEEQVLAEEGEGGLYSTVDTYVRLCGSVRLAMASRLKVYNNWQRAVSTTQSIRAQHDRARQRGAPIMPEQTHELNEAERKAEEAKRDFDDTSKLLKAEMVRFDTEKVEDFKMALQRHVEGLVIRQKQIGASWTAYQDVVAKAIAANPEDTTAHDL